MCKAIKEDILRFNKDVKVYNEEGRYPIKRTVHESALDREREVGPEDDFEGDIESILQNLESWKQFLTTKMEKLDHNNKTLKEIIEGMDENVSRLQKQKNKNLSLINYIYEQLNTIGKGTGFSILDKNPTLLGKRDYSWSSSNDADRELYETMSLTVKVCVTNFEKLFNGTRELYDEYINICKKTFEMLSKIHIAIGKNEGERIKTLKLYEMFKKEYKLLQAPKHLPKSHTDTAFEVKRRIKYKRFLGFALDKLKFLCEHESKRRDDTKNHPRQADREDHPDNLFTDNDWKVDGVDCKVFYFKKMMTELQKACNISIGFDKKASSKDLQEYQDTIRSLKEQHEAEIIHLLEPYKQEIRSIMEEKKSLEDRLAKMQEEHEDLKNQGMPAEIDSLKSQLEELKAEHAKCASNDLLLQKIDALRDRNTELAKERDNKLREYHNKNLKLQETIDGINNRMKEALVKLELDVDVYEDSRFFEHAFKELCKSYYHMSKDIRKRVPSKGG